MIARFQRMRGKNIFYPLGWDDNGLPTERCVQNHYHVWCSNTVPYESNLVLDELSDKEKKTKPKKVISRKNFIESCQNITKFYERQFKELFMRAGFSVDWNEEYATINPNSRKISQLSFLELFERNNIYHAQNPIPWDINFQTAIAQAEIEDREIDGMFYNIQFNVQLDPFSPQSEETFLIGTTRPELLPACVGVATHPEDKRYKHMIGKYAKTPLFNVPVPIFGSTLVDPEKGTGILMVCTFGDSNDVEWWKLKRFPLRQIIGKNGKMKEVKFFSVKSNDSKILPDAHHIDSTDPERPSNGSPDCIQDFVGLNSNNFVSNSDSSIDIPSLDAEMANSNYSALTGVSLNEARMTIITLLGSLVKSSNKIKHSVRYFEKGSRPLEIIPTRQWYLRILDKKDILLEQGNLVKWYPSFMQKKYNDWISGLLSDWCISRQRFFGVPLPIWYRIDENGIVQYQNPILAHEDDLPVDPLFDCPRGFKPDQRDMCNGFKAEDYIFDTWWTSSLTPQIATRWKIDPEKHSKLYPMNLRPQSHEIIRTWAFYTICKSLFHENSIPWREIAISGWIVDEKRAKLSKSKGNAQNDPMDLLNTYGADGVRYWSGLAKLGNDAIFCSDRLAVGKRLVTKLFNAAKLVLMQPARYGYQVTEPLDIALLIQLRDLVKRCNEWFEEYNFQKVLRETEIFFWSRFTDNYLEMIKPRLKMEKSKNDIVISDDLGENLILSDEAKSAIFTSRLTLNIILRLLAPIMPYITEEIWSWSFSMSTGNMYIHTTNYPTPEDIDENLSNISISDRRREDISNELDLVLECMNSLRKAKSDAHLGFSQSIDNFSIELKEFSKIEPYWKDMLFAVKGKNFKVMENEKMEPNQFNIIICDTHIKECKNDSDKKIIDD